MPRPDLSGAQPSCRAHFTSPLSHVRTPCVVRASSITLVLALGDAEKNASAMASIVSACA